MTKLNLSIAMSSLLLKTICSCGLLLLSSGCTSLMGSKSNEPIDGINTKALRAAGYTFDDNGAQRPIPAGGEKPAVVLEVRDGKRHLERIPMTPDKPLFIQDIVHDAKLYEKLGRIKVTILRPTTGTNPPIRMEADFEPGGKGTLVKWQNYALQPGDQVIVTKDNHSWFDDMVTSVIPFKR